MAETKQTSARQERAVRHALVVADFEKPDVKALAGELAGFLRGRGLQRVEVERDPRAPGGPGREGVPDLVVVLGGDGAILGAVRAFAEAPVPMLGINFGRVGFLASVPARRWKEALEEVLSGAGRIEPRMRLQATNGGGTLRAVALNEVVLGREAVQGMLTVALSVDGDWVTDYRSDGLIVSTPSGSTAHSLSAGGPILFPSMLGMIVTPICPQGLAYRPIVLHPDSALEVAVRSSSGPTKLVVDGQGVHELAEGESVRIARHPVPYPLLSWSGLDPYRRLRERLGWSGVISPGDWAGEDAGR